MSKILSVQEATFGKTTIPTKELWGVIDSSKLQGLMDCPRGFFYSYILGWRSEGPAIHLAFGSAWHKAMEVFALKGTDNEAIAEAYQEFIKEYVDRMAMSEDILETLHAAKTPSRAFLGLNEYAQIWKDDPTLTVDVEIAGTAPISPERVIHAKTDQVRIRGPHEIDSGKYYSLEHKTTGRKTQSWMDQWHYYFQVGTYDHFLKCVYDADIVEGIIINGAIFRSKDREFIRIPATRSTEMWEAWINDANFWWDFYEWNMEALYETSPDDRTMAAFPRNSASCSKFGCRFPDLCSVVANPVSRCHSVPFGYKVDYWDPRLREETAKKVVHANEPVFGD